MKMRQNETAFAYLGFVLLAIIVIAAVYLASPGLSFPIEIWGGKGEIVAQYKHEGHYAFHVKANTDQADEANITELVNTCVGLAKNLRPEHGLYIIVEGEGKLAFALGLTYEDVWIWQHEPDVYALDYLLSFEGRLLLRWPTWVDNETIVWGYAWFLGAKYQEDHSWFPDLAWLRPLPLDSKFMIQEK